MKAVEVPRTQLFTAEDTEKERRRKERKRKERRRKERQGQKELQKSDDGEAEK
jgi:hypothetical protein